MYMSNSHQQYMMPNCKSILVFDKKSSGCDIEGSVIGTELGDNIEVA